MSRRQSRLNEVGSIDGIPAQLEAGHTAPGGSDIPGGSAPGLPGSGAVAGAAPLPGAVVASFAVEADQGLALSPLEELAATVRARWAADGTFTPATIEKCGEAVARFCRRLHHQGLIGPAEITAAHCRGFIDATTSGGQRPELTTRHSRRSALRMFFRTLRDLGYDLGDPSLDLVLPARTERAARPLSDLEVTLGRASSRLGEAGGRSLHRAVCWALGETTAVTSEISALRLGDLDDPSSPHWVRLPGTRRHTPRLGELTDWGAAILQRQADLIRQRRGGPTTLLTYRGTHQPGQPAAQSAVCNALANVLTAAGLNEEADVRPASLRNWAGRRLYDGGMPLEQVARRMGTRSLDTTAADIALDWQREQNGAGSG